MTKGLAAACSMSCGLTQARGRQHHRRAYGSWCCTQVGLQLLLLTIAGGYSFATACTSGAIGAEVSASCSYV
jgi:hypothetical protein